MATTRTRKSPTSRRAPEPVNPRTLFLAGLGAVVVARRQAERLAAEAATLPERLKAGANAAVSTARNEARKLRKQAEGRIAPVRREIAAISGKAGKAAEQGIGEVAKRLNPLLARAGLPTIKSAAKASRKAAPAGRTRRPVAKKKATPVRRRAA